MISNRNQENQHYLEEMQGTSEKKKSIDDFVKFTCLSLTLYQPFVSFMDIRIRMLTFQHYRGWSNEMDVPASLALNS